jgi:precorrin-6A/cobalt-precorrin-6A reductase
MILLLGGTSETASLAAGLLKAGHAVLVSTATDVPLALPEHPRLQHRQGRLDGTAMAALMRRQGVQVLLDATHPYASQAREQARQAAALLDLPYLRWERPGTDFSGHLIRWADNHRQAAELAFGDGRPVLLTTGSRHLTPYVEQARRTGICLRARVLPHTESRQAVEQAGLVPEEIIWGLGPFSIKDNLTQIREHAIGVLVTKDSGAAGGVPAKLQAARREGCLVVVIRRPVSLGSEPCFSSLEEVLAALTRLAANPFRSGSPLG